MGDSYGWIGGFDDTGLRLFIPYVIKKKIFVKYLTFHSSPIITGSELSEEEELCFLDNCISQFKISGIDFCTQPVNHAIFRAYPKRSIYAAFGSYILDLTRSEDELWNGFHHKHRNVILNAKKKGVIIKFNMPDSVNISYEIIRRTMFRSKMDMIPKLKFLKLIESLGANICIAIAFHEGKPMGCAVFPFSLYGAYYLYGGSSDLPVLGSMNLLHWEAIKYFKNLDVKRYDFVGARLKPIPGSKVEGIQRFKERFGPVMYKGYLWKIPITYKYYLFEIVLKIKNGFRGDIIDQELLYRNTKNE
jgi:lipid II:glycine glycyltransferase (peptidoglycan interpeptide bridge formation enzyme)